MELGGLTVLDPWLLVQLLSALGIGALIGIERERSESAGSFAGSRTMPLVALLGALTQAFVPSVLPVVTATVGLVVAIGYVAKVTVVGDLGATTAVAALLAFLYGVMTTHSTEGFTVAVVFGVLTTSILAVKGPLHDFVNGLDSADVYATLKFLIVALVVLPLLPDRELSVLFGLNPQFVWLMVVFVSGISLTAYVLAQVLGPGRGIGLVGVLGGLVSSTATTASMAERTSDDPDLWAISGFAVVAASTTMFPRAVLEVAVVNPALLPTVAIPLAVMTVTGGLLSVALLSRFYAPDSVDVEFDNPFRLRPALLFGLIFAVVLVASEFGSTQFGSGGVYVTAFVSGLADVDAIAISLSELARRGSISAEVATTGIVVAAVANTLVKAAIAWLLGTARLGKLALAALGTVSLVGIGVTIAL